MAYKMNVKTASGLEVNDAYVKVERVNGDKKALTAILKAYVSKEFLEDGFQPIKESYFTFIPDVSNGAANFIEQSYNYGKTLEEYKNAIDC